jgi:hypothetical protein
LRRWEEDTGFDFCTFLHPAFFMVDFLENKIKRYAEIRDQRSWTTSVTPTCRETDFALVGHEDITEFVAKVAFQHQKSIISGLLASQVTS